MRPVHCREGLPVVTQRPPSVTRVHTQVLTAQLARHERHDTSCRAWVGRAHFWHRWTGSHEQRRARRRRAISTKGSHCCLDGPSQRGNNYKLQALLQAVLLDVPAKCFSLRPAHSSEVRVEVFLVFVETGVNSPSNVVRSLRAWRCTGSVIAEGSTSPALRHSAPPHDGQSSASL